MFAKGFVKGRKKAPSNKDLKAMGTLIDLPTDRFNKNQFSTINSENKPLYPAPYMQTNVSGTDKYAAAHSLPLPQAPKEPVHGSLGGSRMISKPARVTVDLSPYGAPKGTSGVTGHPLSHPFKHSVRQFGSVSKLRSGLR